VVTITVGRRPVSEGLALVGSIAANEAVEIKAESDGIVQEILFDEGQRVEKGQLLLRLDESKWAAALAEAEANFRLSQANFDRSKQLLTDKLVSQQEYDQAAAVFEMTGASLALKRRLLSDARIYAPFAGTAGARDVSPGQVISRNTALTWIVDLDTVKVEVNVDEKFLGQLRLNQRIEFGVTAFPARKFEGEIYFIAPQLDVATRTALVKTRIANPDHVLRPGMVANLDLRLQLREAAIVIPEVALLYNGDNAFVFIVGADDTAQVRNVQTGLRLPGQVEIARGLEGGERLVVEGHQKVFAGMKVMLTGPAAAAAYLDGPGGPAGKPSGKGGT
jgi:membrane fusion protein (multidrug efflux system)